jgi:uncharacterized protein YoxC
MSDTWAAVLAISVAVMALVQIVYLIGFAIAAKKMMAVASATQQQVETLAADMKLRVGTVTDRVNLVADDVRAVTSRVQEMATSVSDGVHRVEEQVRAAGQRVQQTRCHRASSAGCRRASRFSPRSRPFSRSVIECDTTLATSGTAATCATCTRPPEARFDTPVGARKPRVHRPSQICLLPDQFSHPARPEPLLRLALLLLSQPARSVNGRSRSVGRGRR